MLELLVYVLIGGAAIAFYLQHKSEVDKTADKLKELF